MTRHLPQAEPNPTDGGRGLGPPGPDGPEDRHVIDHVTARRRRGHRRPQITLNLTAMIDVTFLLLTYFIVATQFKQGEEVYRLDLPDRRGEASARDPFELDEEPLRIRVATSGIAPNEYRIQVEGPYPQPRTFAELHTFLRGRRIGAGAVGGLLLPEHPIVIEPTGTTSWQHAIEAFDAVARARFTNVTLGKPG